MGSSRIGTLNESSLHAELKEMVSQPGDLFEQDLDGFVIDIRRGDTLIEIQTRSFASMGRKLDTLLGQYRLELIHPVSAVTYLHKPGRKPRRSPRKASHFDVLDELVSIPSLLDHPNLTVEVLVVTTDAIQEPDPTMRRGRGGWRVVDRRLRTVEERVRLTSMGDLMGWLPADLPEVFTTADIAQLTELSRDQAQRLVYCLRSSDRIRRIDRSRSGHQYVVTST